MSRSKKNRRLTRYDKRLIVLFLFTLPLANPWVRGDGVGYYAYVRSLVIDGNLRFDNEWRAGNQSFVMHRMDERGNLHADQFTSTGYVGNHFTVGPAILWGPAIVSVHLLVRAVNAVGVHIRADGYSPPYVLAMAVTTATYGFLGLFLAFRLARKYFNERLAFWATLGIWFGSSLPVYMYFNPSWSHAHSAFAVALFLWYWHRTRGARTYRQWVILGAIGGLMLNVYYPNAVFLLVPLLESLKGYWQAWREPQRDAAKLRQLFCANLLFAAVVVVCFLPTLITRQIIYGNPLQLGYGSLREWSWTSPVLGKVLFSSEHGLLSWTPVLLPAVLGLFWLRKHDAEFAAYLAVCCLAFFYLIASYPVWAGIASFGNRFFVSLTPVFVVGLAASLDAFMHLWQRQAAWVLARFAVLVFMVWNLGFIFQWGTHLVPARGPISWRQMAYNQVRVVPWKILRTLEAYLVERQALMGNIEQQDIQQMQKQAEENR